MKEKALKEYEVLIENRKNTIWSNFVEPIRLVLAAENKQQAIDLAAEIISHEYWMSRGKVKITAERI